MAGHKCEGQPPRHGLASPSLPSLCIPDTLCACRWSPTLAPVYAQAAGGAVIQLFGTWRIDGSLAVARAIGDADFSRYVSCHPSVSCRQLSRRDRWLVIASDGLYDVMTNEEVAQFCRAQHQLTAAKMSEALVREAVRNRGSGDNTTAVAVRIQYA